MIHTALEFISQTLNSHLQQINGITSNLVSLTNIASESGIIIPDDSIGVSLVNIEEERIFKEQRFTVINRDGIVETRNPEIKLNLYVLFAANYQREGVETDSSDYIEGLKQLSNIISFFQARNVFTSDNYPLMAEMDPKLTKLVIELYSYTFEQMYNFWSVLGAKYLPSVLYKVRLISIQEEEIMGMDKPIEKITIDGKTA